MSNSLKFVCQFDALKDALQFLYGTPNNAHSKSDDGWSENDWGWESMETDVVPDDDAKINSIETYLVSVSPTGSLVAFAYSKRLSIFERKKSDAVDTMELVWKGDASLEPDEEITSVLCIPIASQRKSGQGNVDWTCVLVGFSSGYIRVFTHNGVLLFSQLLHIGPVLKLKCRTCDPLSVSLCEKVEELTVLYPKSLVLIDGFSFVQSLRACRNQIARSTATGIEHVQPPPLAYKKWGLHNQEHIVDHTSCGLVKPSKWDELHYVSSQSFGTPIKNSSSAYSLYMTTGVRPFVGFFYGVEGSAQLMFSDVAYSVASKLTSALFSAAGGIFGLGRKTEPETPEKKIEPSTPLTLRFGLPDRRRAGETLILSASNALAATVDSFGRVMLIDIHMGIIVRVWKGYRDSQIAFVRSREVRDDSFQEQPLRSAEFLVIYVPRRGLLEVWCLEQGPRVASYQVQENSLLLPISHGLLGLNSSTMSDLPLLQCALVSSDGKVHTLELPFHLSLCDKSNTRAHAVVILKEIQVLLNEGPVSEPLLKEITNRIRSIKLPSVLQQALEAVLASTNVTTEHCCSLLNFIKDSITARESIAEHSELGVEEMRLKFYCVSQLTLIDLFKKLTAIFHRDGAASDVLEDAPGPETVLRLTDDVSVDLKNIVKLYETTLANEIGKDVEVMSLSEFISSFEYKIRHDTDDKKGIDIFISDSLTDEVKVHLEQFIFSKSFHDYECTKLLCPVLIDCKLPAEQLCRIMLSCWLSQRHRKIDHTRNFYSLMKTISSMTSEDELIVEANQISPWWQQVRLFCSKSHCVVSALLAAASCRSVAISRIVSRQNPEESPVEWDTIELSDWESLSVESENWDVIIRQLSDLTILGALLNISTDVKCNDADLVVSLNAVLEGGRGVIAELIAKWVVRNQYDVDSVVMPADCDFPLGGSSSFQELLHELYKRFPSSITMDIVFANCAWEYLAAWYKTTSDLHLMESSIKFLDKIELAPLQHGIALMLWDTFIQPVATSCDKLFEKVGKAPKDRVCRKETGLSDKEVTYFLELLCGFLQILMSANCRLTGDRLYFDIEDYWQEAASPKSLSDVACKKDPTNYNLLRHHLHLFTVLHAIILFQMKSIRPRSLFDTKGNRAFLQNLVSFPFIPAEDVDLAIVNARRHFWKRVLSECVCALCDARAPLVECTTLTWVETSKLIGSEMAIHHDELQRHFIVELFNYGLDKLALNEIENVDDHCVLASQLTIVAGQRIAHFILNCDGSGSSEKLSKASPTLTIWLKSLNSSELGCPNPPLKDTAALLHHVVGWLSEEQSEFKMASEMIDLVQAL